MPNLFDYLPHATLIALLEVAIVVLVIPWVLLTKKDPTSAVAWCLIVLLVPFLGALLFWGFGYNYIHRLRRKRRHRAAFHRKHPPKTQEATREGGESAATEPTWNDLGRLARKVDAFPISRGNGVTFYHDTHGAFAALLDAVGQARHHVHLEFYIFRSDSTGQQLVDLLTARAKEGVEVRLLYDAMGCVRTRRRLFEPLLAAGGKVHAFLPLNPLRSRIQVNLRNHRKIVVVDGRVGFTGGMNIGDEYLGKDAYFGYWRDEFLKLEGPAVAGLQRVFVEDWDFAAHEPLDRGDYYPEVAPAGDAVVQVIESGPDQEVNGIREVFFAAILGAQERLWISSPYFVPDASMLDALRLARLRGVDVRLLSLYRPDHFLSFYAGRYYWTEMLAMGARVYQYRKGMMHAKILTADGQWALVGSPNLDNRSLRLNFEVACMLHTPALAAELEAQFERDLLDAVPLDLRTYAARPLADRLTENACRLFSPFL
jgi:cardiolipin synthase